MNKSEKLLSICEAAAKPASARSDGLDPDGVLAEEAYNKWPKKIQALVTGIELEHELALVRSTELVGANPLHIKFAVYHPKNFSDAEAGPKSWIRSLSAKYKVEATNVEPTDPNDGSRGKWNGKSYDKIVSVIKIPGYKRVEVWVGERASQYGDPKVNIKFYK